MENKNSEKIENNKENSKILKWEKFIKATSIIACILVIIGIIFWAFEEIAELNKWDISEYKLISDIVSILEKNGYALLVDSSIATLSITDIKKEKDKNRPKAKQLNQFTLGASTAAIIFQVGYIIGGLIKLIADNIR